MMNESVVQSELFNQELYSSFLYFLFFGGILTAVGLCIFLFRHPVNRKQLTRRIRRRAFSFQQLLFLFTVYFLVYLSAGFIRYYFWRRESSSFNLGTLLIIDLFAVFSIIGINYRNKRTWAEQFGMSWSECKVLIFSPFIYLAMIPFIMLATFGYHYFLYHFFSKGGLCVQRAVQEIVQTHSGLKICYILTAIFVASVCEEVVFRGILFPTVVRYLGLWSGVTIVSGVFALIHLHVPSLVSLFLLSTVLCVAYWRTGSLWVSIGIHSIFNSVAILNLLH